MHKHLRNRIFRIVLALVILGGIFILGIRKHRESQMETFPERVSESSAPQDTFPTKAAPTLGARDDGQLPEEISFPVALVPGLVPADQIPEKFPPAARITDRNPTDEVKAEIERLTEGMDAFTAAKQLNELEPGRGGLYGPYIREFAAQAFAEHPNDAEVVQFWARLQQIPAWRGSNPEAIAAYRALLELRPDSQEALLGLSQALWYAEPEETLGHLAKAEELTSGYDSLIVKLKAKVYQRLGDYDTALTLLKAYRDTRLPALEQVLLHSRISFGSPRAYYDTQIRAIEEGKPLIEPHPRYLEAPQGAEEGFRRLRGQDSALAAEMARHLRRASSEESPSSDAPSDEE
ncbi:hypothetical protein C6495_14795 [Candidatus Poribacteria bacterium]|nr:MAG: hypothetical protein C6495_14795 [Candidatus Poribacteria bacterium]